MSERVVPLLRLKVLWEINHHAMRDARAREAGLRRGGEMAPEGVRSPSASDRQAQSLQIG